MILGKLTPPMKMARAGLHDRSRTAPSIQSKRLSDKVCLSPGGAAVNSPGREPRDHVVATRLPPFEPRRGDRSSGRAVGSVAPPGLRRGNHGPRRRPGADAPGY